MRRVIVMAGVLMALSLAAGTSQADIPSDRPRPVTQPSSNKPPDPPPQPRPICGAGMGLVVLAVGIYGAWRFAPGRFPAAPGSLRSQR